MNDDITLGMYGESPPTEGWQAKPCNEYAEPTEMAGVAEADFEAAYAWALDYDNVTNSRRCRRSG